MGGVERMKRQLDPLAFVVTMQLRIAVLVANAGAAGDVVDLPDAAVVPGTAEGELAGSALWIAGAESLFVPVHELADVVDDVQPVVGLVAVGQRVGRPRHNPHSKLTSRPRTWSTASRRTSQSKPSKVSKSLGAYPDSAPSRE